MQVLTVEFATPSAPELFVESLKNTGFAVIKNHPVAHSLINDVYAEWQQFFQSDEKKAYLYHKETQDGFFPFRSENAKDAPKKDLKEFYMYYPWGQFPQTLSHKTALLYQQLSALAATLLTWIENFTPPEIKAQFSRPLADMIKDSPRTVMRILHYPPLSGDEEEGAVRAAEHEDIDLLTLLPAATATGLEVKDTGSRWHAIDSDPGTIVVNAGDMLALCSDYYYISTTHRVINPSGEAAKASRLSMPLFLHPHDDVQLSKTQTAKSYLWQRLSELGLI